MIKYYCLEERGLYDDNFRRVGTWDYLPTADGLQLITADPFIAMLHFSEWKPNGAGFMILTDDIPAGALRSACGKISRETRRRKKR